MLARKYVVLFEHPHYPEIYLFDQYHEALAKHDELMEENNRKDGHNDGFLYVGSMVGIFTKIKTYY